MLCNATAFPPPTACSLSVKPGQAAERQKAGGGKRREMERITVKERKGGLRTCGGILGDKRERRGERERRGKSEVRWTRGGNRLQEGV